MATDADLFRKLARMIIAFLVGFLCGAGVVAFALRRTKPSEPPKVAFTAVGAGGNKSIDAHSAYQLRRIFSDFEAGQCLKL
jgi:hypothetical protein